MKVQFASPLDDQERLVLRLNRNSVVGAYNVHFVPPTLGNDEGGDFIQALVLQGVQITLILLFILPV